MLGDQDGQRDDGAPQRPLVSAAALDALECAGKDDRPFPTYVEVLAHLSAHDDLWAAYDVQVHAMAQDFAARLLCRDALLGVAARIVQYQTSYDEEGDDVMRTVLYVLKSIVPDRDRSAWQNAVKRAELWCVEARLA